MLKIAAIMAQVIIVSNRLPISVTKEEGKLVFSPSVGGMATGLASYVNNRKGNLWIGWPGIASDDLTPDDRQEISEELAKQGYVPIFLSKKQIDNFYNGYSNSVLWPDFHNLPMRPIEEEEMTQWWRSYQTVNRMFSEMVLAHAEYRSQVWVHDYLLMLMPEMLRQDLKDSNIGFFLHIPFPPKKQLKRLPQAEKLLRGMLGADLIGFHTPEYVKNFTANVEHYEIGSIDQDHTVDLGKRLVRAAEFPMGIDFNKFTEANKSKGVRTIARGYRKQYRGLRVIASVDRLDPSKGLVERLKAYRQFLRLYPAMRTKVVFVMVAAPSRTSIAEYKNLGLRLDKLASEINQEFATPKWKPLEYINVPLLFENVTALFQIANVAFITPLRDGMNLAAKEFVASNRRGGVLILSQTAGAAEELKDALIVDPRNTDMLADALNIALKMRRRELLQRLRRMRRHLSNNTVQSWAKGFVDSLQQPVPGTPNIITRTLSQRLETKLIRDYSRSSQRLMLLDYDGTLVPFSEDYASLKPPKNLISLLQALARPESNEVVLISGRSQAELDKWFGQLPINLVAEHGASIRRGGNKKWEGAAKNDPGWKDIVEPIVKRYVQLTPGSSLEVKSHSLVWHYRAASPYHAQKYLVTLKRVLRPLIRRHDLQIMQGNKVLEIKNPNVSKGVVASHWLEKKPDFILAVGDDVTDEDLFSVLPPSANSIKVGRGLSRAKFRLASYRQVKQLLKHLS